MMIIITLIITTLDFRSDGWCFVLPLEDYVRVAVFNLGTYFNSQYFHTTLSI